MNDLSDEVLLKRVVAREEAALELLYERHAQIVYNLIMRIVRETSIADELLQEVFWQVWQQASKYRGTGAAAAWIYRIARNKSLDQLRRQSARPQTVETKDETTAEAMLVQIPAENAEVEPITEQNESRRSVREALQQIPDEQRNCLELAYFSGLSQREIAEQTNTPLGTIKTRMRSGMEKLERILSSAGYQ